MIQQRTLAPGMTLHAMQTDKFKTACFSINFVRPHSAADAALDALLPSVLLRATERYPDIRSISQRLDELYGATFGTLVRRKGEVKLTGFYADFVEDALVPEGAEIFQSMVDFAGEVLLHPYLEEGCFALANVEGEKRNLINAIEATMNDKRTYANQRMLQVMCAGEAYGVPRLGRAEEVAKITGEGLFAHWKQVLATSRVEIFYAGRVEADRVAQAFARLFGPVERQQPVPVSTRVIGEPGELRRITESMDVTQGKLSIGFRTGITVTDPDYPALLLLNAVLGAGATSKLFLNVREKRSLCYYASSSVDVNKGLMLLSSGIDQKDYQVALEAIFHELEECKTGNITEEELAAARRQLLSGFRAAEDAPAQLDEFYIGRALTGGPSIQQMIDAVQVCRVEDLVRAARRIRPDTIYFLKGEDE